MFLRVSAESDASASSRGAEKKKPGKRGGRGEMGSVEDGREVGRKGRRGWILPQLNSYTMMGSPSPMETSLLVLYGSVGRS